LIKDSNFRVLYEFSEDATMLLDEASFLHCNDATLRIFACPSIKLLCTQPPSDISPQYQPCDTDSLSLAEAHINEHQAENVLLSIQAGMGGILTKPFSQNNLINELDSFIHCRSETNNH
jgi:hypothetical protein